MKIGEKRMLGNLAGSILLNKIMSLFFITSNKNKLEEVKAVLGNIEQLDIDLPAIKK